MGSFISAMKQLVFPEPCLHSCDCDCHPWKDQGIEVKHPYGRPCCERCRVCGYNIKVGLFEAHMKNCHKSGEKGG